MSPPSHTPCVTARERFLKGPNWFTVSSQNTTLYIIEGELLPSDNIADIIEELNRGGGGVGGEEGRGGEGERER